MIRATACVAPMASESEAEAALPNGVNGKHHSEDEQLDDLNDANDGDLFGDGSDADADG